MMLFSLLMIFILLSFFLLDANAYLENQAYTLKWNLILYFQNKSYIAYLIFLSILIPFFMFCYSLMKKNLFSKKKELTFTNIIKTSDWNKEKKINTELSLKRLHNSREYQHYLNEKKNGKYPEIKLEEEEKIKFSDED